MDAARATVPHRGVLWPSVPHNYTPAHTHTTAKQHVDIAQMANILKWGTVIHVPMAEQAFRPQVQSKKRHAICRRALHSAIPQVKAPIRVIASGKTSSRFL